MLGLCWQQGFFFILLFLSFQREVTMFYHTNYLGLTKKQEPLLWPCVDKKKLVPGLQDKQGCCICTWNRSLCPHALTFLLTSFVYIHIDAGKSLQASTHKHKQPYRPTSGQYLSNQFPLADNREKRKETYALKNKIILCIPQKVEQEKHQQLPTLTDSCLDYTPMSCLCVSTVWVLRNKYS